MQLLSWFLAGVFKLLLMAPVGFRVRFKMLLTLATDLNGARQSAGVELPIQGML